jgi:hypothetical protein
LPASRLTIQWVAVRRRTSSGTPHLRLSDMKRVQQYLHREGSGGLVVGNALAAAWARRRGQVAPADAVAAAEVPSYIDRTVPCRPRGRRVCGANGGPRCDLSRAALSPRPCWQPTRIPQIDTRATPEATAADRTRQWNRAVVAPDRLANALRFGAAAVEGAGTLLAAPPAGIPVKLGTPDRHERLEASCPSQPPCAG